jgi:formylglycine-generating enzyme required for sulfatase activity
VDIPFETIEIDRVLAEMENARNAVNIVILDACRNNPYASRFRTINRGLSVVEAPAGSLIVYSTAPGDVAAEGRGRNGIFTGALLKHIMTPGIEVREMLTRVRRDVLAATGNEQIPWDSSSLTAGFYFSGAAGLVAEEPGAEHQLNITVEKAHGVLAVQVRTAGLLYLDGTRQVRILSGGTARIVDLESGKHSLEMRYEDGYREEQTVIVEKDQIIQVIFGYTQQSLSSVQPGFVLVEAGSFSMGSNDGDDDEKPMHTVTISRSFYMSRYEVIQKQWREVMGTNPSNFKGDDLPVETVSWYDVVEYCNRLSTREGLTPCYTQEGSSATHSNQNSVLFILTGGQRQSEDLKVERVIRCDFSATGYRLPTEAEWEYAARGGLVGMIYPNGDTINPTLANYRWSGIGGTVSVGSYLPNGFGLHSETPCRPIGRISPSAFAVSGIIFRRARRGKGRGRLIAFNRSLYRPDRTLAQDNAYSSLPTS